MMQQQVKTQYAQQVQEQMASMQPAELIGALTQTAADPFRRAVCFVL